MSTRALDRILPVFALAPAADRYNLDPATDIIALKNYEGVAFIILHGVGTTGTVVVTIEECDDVTPTNSTASGFSYKQYASATTAGAAGNWATAAAAGFTIAAGSSQLYAVDVRAADLADGFPFVRMVLTEGVDSPVAAGVAAVCYGPRYGEENLRTALV